MTEPRQPLECDVCRRRFPTAKQQPARTWQLDEEFFGSATARWRAADVAVGDRADRLRPRHGQEGAGGVTVSAHHLQLDLAKLTRSLADRIRDRRDRPGGAERLLVALVRAGLDEEALIPAAALALELDRPNHNGLDTAGQENTPPS